MTKKKTEEQEQQEKSKNEWKDGMLIWGVGRARNGRGEEKSEIKEKEKKWSGIWNRKEKEISKKNNDTLLCNMSDLH